MRCRPADDALMGGSEMVLTVRAPSVEASSLAFSTPGLHRLMQGSEAFSCATGRRHRPHDGPSNSILVL